MHIAGVIAAEIVHESADIGIAAMRTVDIKNMRAVPERHPCPEVAPSGRADGRARTEDILSGDENGIGFGQFTEPLSGVSERVFYGAAFQVGSSTEKVLCPALLSAQMRPRC